ncbi:centrosomal protein of 131 kDa-like [Ptychodera flava]|uniref:centrosomal protein of 131 kDa-like n=1 Tax=Ptychodera flava TaxID=63121 RepID=UPI00396A9475
MARSTFSSSDLDLSLTGSQFSSSKRPNSAGRSRPASSSGRRQGSARGANGPVGAGGDAAKQKHTRGGSHNAQLSQRSQIGDSVSRGSSRQPQRSASNDDFLALFDSSHQPLVKTTKKENRPSANAAKVLWDPPSARAFPIPSSARSTSTTDSSPLNSTRGQTTGTRHTQQLNSESDIANKRSPVSQSYTTTTNILRGSNTNNVETLNQNFVPSANKRSPASANLRPNNAPAHPTQGVRVGGRSSAEASPQSQNSVVEDYITTVNKAAATIQRAYREYSEKKAMEGENEIRRLLANKKREKEEEMKREQENMNSVFESHKRSEDERKRMRDEKARQARQSAIQELQKKRESRRQEVKEKAEKELSYLQASGKVTKKPSTGSRTQNRSRAGSNASSGSGAKRKTNKNMTLALDMDSESESVPSNRPATASSVSRRVDEMFEESTIHNETTTSKTGEAAPEVDATSSAPTKTTLNDLLATIKMLEEPEELPDVEKKEKPKPDWLEMLEKDDSEDGHEGKRNSDLYLSTEKLDQFNNTRKSGKPSSTADPMSKYGKNALLTDDKLRSIMSFLDEVDKADDESDKEEDKTPDAGSNPGLLVPSAEELAKMEQASAAASEVTSTVLSQKLELDEKSRSIKMLQKALNQQRELTVRHAKEQDKEMKQRLALQKDEYEGAIKRHLSFIDQLIDDKKALSDKYDQVVTELKQMDKKYLTKIKKMEEDHSIEVKKIKEVNAAAEKIRREKWIDEKTKKIKEITVKGLEPEIQRLIAKHKAEIKKIKTIHEAELLQGEERAGQKYIKHIEELRDQLAEEKESACNREREQAKQRYEKQLEQEESAFQQQRRRLYAEIQDEKDRLAEQARRQKQELDRLQIRMEENNRKALETMRHEYEKNREESDRRHNSEIRELEERLKVEKEAWEENYMKKQETWLLAKERELKENVRRDRDKEIELVIQRLEDDNIATREECERAAENRVKRIRDKYEAELREVERSERNTQERLNDLKAKLADVEGESIRLRGLLNQKEQEVDDIKEECDRLNRERKNVQDVVRQEFADRLVETEEENKRLKTEMSEMRARHKLEIDRIQKEKEEEMAEVHTRVRQAIVKKEETVSQLKQQHAAAVKRADHLESLLDQQRKQLLQLKK